MTLRTFSLMFEQMAIILKMETGETTDTPASLTGDNAFALAQRIFPKGRRGTR